MKRLLSATLSGFRAEVVYAEGVFNRGLPGFSIVGLANSEIQESKERVKAALSSIGFNLPPLKVVINLAPSQTQKSGTHFDLAIALLIFFQKSEIDLSDYFVFGELGLDGAIKDTQSIYPLIVSLYKDQKIKKAIIPTQSLQKLSNIPEIELIPVSHIQEAISFLEGKIKLDSQKTQEIEYPFIEITGERYYYLREFIEDFSEIKGQRLAKRAALIAASGFHNMLLEGSPGIGKSMIAKRIRYILPPMKKSEILKVAKLQALSGIEPTFKPIRPFRHPHHSSTKASIFGGGAKEAKVGEVALADSGVLFFDELPHFSKDILEALREPLEDNKIVISRVNSKIEYETSFLFIAAQNPCPCGNLLNPNSVCRCTEAEIAKYKNRLSEPFLDRIDIFVQMQENDNDTDKISSSELFEQVLIAFKMQKARSQEVFNGKLSDSQIEEYCKLDSESSALLDSARSRFGLSMRSVSKIKKVARTIADLDESEIIQKKHLLEALSLRRR